MPSNPVYNTPFHTIFDVPPNSSKWWNQKKKNPIVRAVVSYALTLKEPFTISKLYDEARFYNGNLVKDSGAISPSKNKMRAMIRFCGYFKPLESHAVANDRGWKERLWGKK